MLSGQSLVEKIEAWIDLQAHDDDLDDIPY